MDGAGGASSGEQVILAATIIIALAAIVSAVSATISVVLTRKLSEDNRVLRKAGTEPDVVAYLQIGPRRGLLNFVLANVGQGPARHVEVSFLADTADFASHEIVPQPNQYQKVATVLPQGDRHEMFFGRAIAAFREPRLQPFKASVRFTDIRDREVENTFDLDLSPFESSTYVTIKTEHDIALALEELNRRLRSVIGVGPRLRVETITAQEQERRDQEFLRQQRERTGPHAGDEENDQE